MPCPRPQGQWGGSWDSYPALFHHMSSTLPTDSPHPTCVILSALVGGSRPLGWGPGPPASFTTFFPPGDLPGKAAQFLVPPTSCPHPLAHHRWLSALTSVMGLPAPDCWCCRLLAAKPFFSFYPPGSLCGLNTTSPEAFPLWTLPLPLPPGHLSTTVLAPSHTSCGTSPRLVHPCVPHPSDAVLENTTHSLEPHPWLLFFKPAGPQVPSAPPSRAPPE